MFHEQFEHQNVANSMENERFEFKNAAVTVEMEPSSSKMLQIARKWTEQEIIKNRKTGKTNPQK